ncbi:MAG: hypothetical protein Q7R87_00660 [Nanoarchaeota archaeon]|nr:hypothetical protein [Nanoarchaeota archaeon]
MKLLFYSSRFKMFDRSLLDAIQERGIELKRLDSLRELDDIQLDQYRGMIAHPGVANQREFTDKIARYSSLDVIVFTNLPRDYEKLDGRIPVYAINNVEGILAHFEKKR